jgi:hypothetical protein
VPQPIHQNPFALRNYKVGLDITFSLSRKVIEKILAIFYLELLGIDRSRYEFESDVLNLVIFLRRIGEPAMVLHSS